MTHSFTVILDVTTETLDDLEKVYTKIDDALLYIQFGDTGLDFDREADSLEDAVKSAVQDLEEIGFKVKRIESLPESPEVEPGYWERLMERLRELPDAIEAPGEDPEPFV